MYLRKNSNLIIGAQLLHKQSTYSFLFVKDVFNVTFFP
jgi:hypothetical protein